MTLEDFEKELAASRKEDRPPRSKRKDKDSRRAEHPHRHRQRHHNSSQRRESEDHDQEQGHKRRRLSSVEDGGKGEIEDGERHSSHHHRHRRHLHRSEGRTDKVEDRGEDDKQRASSTDGLKRDAWMEAPSAIDIDYVQKKKQKSQLPPPKAGPLGADFDLKLHERELNHHLRDVRDEISANDQTPDRPSPRETTYTFGDAGSQWRMTKLKQLYRQAAESGRSVDEVALDRYGDLREFDDAREEQIELERRQTYGANYIGKVKPSGELFQERKVASDIRASRAPHDEGDDDLPLGQSSVVHTEPPQVTTQPLDQTSLNKMKARLLKAQLRHDPQAAQLEEEYNQAVASLTNQRPEVVVLSAMDNRMISTAPRNEAKPVLNRRRRDRGTLEENEDLSIEDMVREERRTRGQAGGEGRRFAERIAKDAKFDSGLDYMDENASKLAKRVQNSEINLRNTTINDLRKMNRILDSCPLCHHEDTNTPPIAPVISLATRTYLTLPTEPEVSPGGACIIPMQHRTNLLECDDDEWEEVRNFMKSLTRLYHDQDRSVIFYENAADPARRRHAAMQAIPLPRSAAETCPAFFKEALLASEGEWSQHKKIIDTLRRSREGMAGQGNSGGGGGGGGGPMGKLAFRRSLVKEMPYFHVWFEMDGGFGHVVEDPARWPRGDLFAREVIGAMVDADAETVRRQGRWSRQHGGGQDPRIETFKRGWKKWDWTRVLVQEAG